MALTAGARLGPYEILGLIGAGGMGEVYRAHDPRTGRDVAIKVSAAHFSERFDREVRAVAALNHPNICTLYDVGPNYLVMEYVEGAPLGRVEGVRKLLDIAIQIADGMQAAHAAGIVHRDLKPANILLTRDGRIKILDFGLAKSIAAPTEVDSTLTLNMTETGTVVGTVAYMSPEQALGSSDVDARSDQFSFGLVLYELVTGRRAFERRSTAETMTAIIREEADPLPATIPAPLRWTLERCLSKDPEQRYQSSRDLYLELRQMTDRLSGPISVEAPVKRRRIRAAIWLAPVCLAIGFLAAALWPAPVSGPGRAMPFATEAEIQAMPAWSPKGDRIAYSADVNGIFQIFTKQLGSSARTQITRQSVSSYYPFWSNDGTRVYYTANRNLWSISMAGGQAEKVLDGILEATLSPDGRTMAVLAREPGGSYRLAFSSPPGAPPQPYALEPVSKLRPNIVGAHLSFSEDGKYLGLYTDARGKLEFWKIPMNGGQPEAAPFTKRVNSLPQSFVWLAGGRSILFGADITEGSGYLSIGDLTGGNVQPLTSANLSEAYPAISRDHGVLAYAAGNSGYDVVEVPLDGSAQRDVIATSRSETAPSVVPTDGTHFAYVTSRSGADEIWLHNRGDGSDRLLVGHKEFVGDSPRLLDCAISPDGNRVAYRRVDSGAVEIWIAPISGEAPVRLWEDPDRAFQRGAAWSPDGNWIAYYSVRDGKNVVLKARVGAQTPSELVAYTGGLNPVRWSPRGDWIAFQDSAGLRIVSPDGKQDRFVSPRQWLTHGFSNDGLYLYGIGLDKDRHLNVARIEISTGLEKKIADLGPQPAAMELGQFRGNFAYRGFSMNPDGKSFLTSVYRAKLDLWLVKDFNQRTRLIDWLWQK